MLTSKQQLVTLTRYTRYVTQRLYSSQGLPKQTQPPKQYSILDIRKKYLTGKPLSMCTAYDYITASWVNQAQCDLLLVGDSLAMTSLGYESTTELSLDEFKYHVKAVCRNRDGPSLIVSDMPHGSYEVSEEDALRNAFSIMKLSPRVTSLKLEVGPTDSYTMNLVTQLCSRGVPIMGHIGLTPQRASSLGGFKVQGNKSVDEAVEIYKTAKRLQQAGCWSMVIEAVPHKIASFITSKLSIPTIGIGAGNGTSGQVLVVADMLGLQCGSNIHLPKFVQQYNYMATAATDAISQYSQDVNSRLFPETDVHTFKVKDEIFDEFVNVIEKNNL